MHRKLRASCLDGHGTMRGIGLNTFGACGLRQVERLRKELELRREAAVTKIQSCMLPASKTCFEASGFRIQTSGFRALSFLRDWDGSAVAE